MIGNFEPLHTSELASAVATIEHNHGDRGQVRRLFKHALLRPTENTVAQAAWISRHMPSFEVPESSLSVPLAFEARAWECAGEARYEEAIDLSRQWLRDEPFATRGALFGSWLAAVALGDFQTGKELVSAARLANPDDPRLILQLLYCVASLDDPDEAERLLVHDLPLAVQRQPDRIPTEDLQVLDVADRGLIAYRRGLVVEGRQYYERAMELARKSGSRSLELGALLNMLREEARTNPRNPIPWDEAKDALGALPASERLPYEAFAERGKVLQRLSALAQAPRPRLLGG